MTWDLLSDNLIYSSIAVYVLAMVAYAAETATRVGRGVRVTADAPLPARVGSRTGTGAPEFPTPAATKPTPGARVGAIGSSLTVLGLLLNLAGVVARGLAAERAPWGNMYEFAIVITMTAGATYLALLRRQPVRDLGAWIVGAIVLTLGLAVTVLYTPAGDLVPVLDSYWLVVHVAAAIISGGVFTVGALTTVLFLVRQRHDAQAAQAGVPGRGRYAAQLPTADTL
nr:cytochrome c biogenesis protein CcsA [Actinomycetota bacterium]